MICVLSMVLRTKGPSSWSMSFQWSEKTLEAALGYSDSWRLNNWFSFSVLGLEKSESWTHGDTES